MDSTFKLICSDFKCLVTNIFRYEADNAKGDEKAPTLFGGRFRGYLVFDTGWASIFNHSINFQLIFTIVYNGRFILLHSIIRLIFRKDYHYHWLIVINFAVMYNLFFVIGRSVFWELDSLFPRVRIKGVSEKTTNLSDLRVGFWSIILVMQSTCWTCWWGCMRATSTRASWWRRRPCWGRTTGRAGGSSWTYSASCPQTSPTSSSRASALSRCLDIVAVSLSLEM